MAPPQEWTFPVSSSLQRGTSSLSWPLSCGSVLPTARLCSSSCAFSLPRDPCWSGIHTHLSQCEISSCPWIHAQKVQLQHTSCLEQGQEQHPFPQGFLHSSVVNSPNILFCKNLAHPETLSCILNKDKTLENKARPEQNNTGLRNLRMSWNTWAGGLTWSHKISFLINPNSDSFVVQP